MGPRGASKRMRSTIFDREGAAVAEKRSEQLVGHVDLDPEAFTAFVPPLAHVGDAGEDQREAKGDAAFVEALLAAADAHGSLIIDPERRSTARCWCIPR